MSQGMVMDSRSAATSGGAEMMRAARLHQPGEPMVIDRIPKPTPRPTDVLVQVKACGVVPNLVNVAGGRGSSLSREGRLPLPAIYGLDPAGVIVEKGDLVHGLEIGDRVYVNPARYCGGCRYCRAGEVGACQYATLNGYFAMGAKGKTTFEDYPYGGYAEFMTAPQYSLVKLPDNLSYEMAARWGYLGTAYGALRRGDVDVNTTVLINGISGTLGLGAALFALALGAPKILGVGRRADLLEKVKALAPDRIHVRTAEGGESIAEWARGLTDGDGVDVVIEALPTGAPPEALLAALAALGRGGRHVNVSGVYADVPINFLDMVTKTQTFIGSYWFSTAQGQEMAALASAGLINLGVFEHEIFALEDINKALETIGDRNGGFSNYVISMEAIPS